MVVYCPQCGGLPRSHLAQAKEKEETRWRGMIAPLLSLVLWFNERRVLWGK